MALDFRRVHGFTLLELLIAVTVLLIFASLAIPSFRAFVNAQERELFAHELASGLRAARLEAITRNRMVIVQALEGDWAKGWEIIVDETGQGALDPNNPTIAKRQGSGRVQVIASRNMQSQVAFSYLGVPRAMTNGALNGSIHLCDLDGEDRHVRVVLARSGRVRVANSVPANPVCPLSSAS